MRELSFEEVNAVSGTGRLDAAMKFGITFFRDYLFGKALDTALNSFSGGVDPGSNANTNPSSRDAVNGSDSMSDHFAGGTGGFGSSPGGTTGGADGGDE